MDFNIPDSLPAAQCEHGAKYLLVPWGSGLISFHSCAPCMKAMEPLHEDEWEDINVEVDDEGGDE